MLRIGVLGAARIAPQAVIRPANACPDAEVVAVAARDKAKAAAFASEHGIPAVRDSYQDLLDDPGIDAVYNPLPNGLHGRWTLAALAAGKHVLCEKPFTANAAEAKTVADAAQASGLVVMEAFHYRYHPMAKRAVEIVRSGELGVMERVEAAMSFPLPKFSDIRYNLGLAGGALMDAGCYPVHLVRSLTGAQPRVLSARATLHRPNVDRAMTAEVRFDEGYTAEISCSLWSRSLLRLSAKVYGSDGVMRLINPYAPHMFNRMTVVTNGHKRIERVSKRPTYAYQLDAFVAAVEKGEPVLTPPADAVKNMALIDAIYVAAGLQPRVPTD
ncbi:Gfo/Idh/MocA family protein [Kibdelosporangium phytohabitans]|uniref:Oxidoreductase n=1 Tax=Kibdelosporangium phytohabitans TaxID=860235 RepID=A0A0N9HZD8_9PSEU|nr:Gfo/Idh/MocA family oxidoreductase [Kibdelosporangium phytohabitans]ALG07236.1 oxidoreductase [Kibdelosporangium phytohabitans]MBE1471909.1 putative dehydrogenase [Kibdelosporangium phytohabitans]